MRKSAGVYKSTSSDDVSRGASHKGVDASACCCSGQCLYETGQGRGGEERLTRGCGGQDVWVGAPVSVLEPSGTRRRGVLDTRVSGSGSVGRSAMVSLGMCEDGADEGA